MKNILRTILFTVLIPSASQALSPTGSIQVTTPQRYSLSVGVCGGDFLGVFNNSSGFVLRAEPGVSGGKLHLGMRFMFSFTSLPLASADITASVLQTWNDPWGEIEGGQTYAGAEYRLGLRFLVATAGYYRRVAGDSENEWISSFGAGIGF